MKSRTYKHILPEVGHDAIVNTRAASVYIAGPHKHDLNSLIFLSLGMVSVIPADN